MKKIIISASLIIFAILVSTIVYFLKFLPGSDAEILVISQGTFNGFQIGDSKKEIISRNPEMEISAFGVKCLNWLPANSAKDVVERCFTSSNEWSVSKHGEFCSENRDKHTLLYFQEMRLSKVVIRCTYPI
ncbi:hypothetical protein [Microbulbifer sp. JMSA003]|uniref:hypothetical protein n=1 Tax=Microbulbifer sp. JMSA003 TaxID=3243369 RepID=UPI00403980CA